MEWKDATSYSRCERGAKPPDSWETKINNVRIWVSRGHLGHPGCWVMNCRDLFLVEKYLGDADAMSAEDAQEQAIRRVIDAAQQRANALFDLSYAARRALESEEVG